MSIKKAFFLFIVRPIVLVIAGVSLKTLEKVRPIGAWDYFCNKPYKKWLSKHLIDLIALKRRPSKTDGHPFEEIYEALPKGEALFVPFVIEVNVGEAVFYEGEEKNLYVKQLEESVHRLEKVHL